MPEMDSSPCEPQKGKTAKQMNDWLNYWRISAEISTHQFWNILKVSHMKKVDICLNLFKKKVVHLTKYQPKSSSPSNGFFFSSANCFGWTNFDVKQENDAWYVRGCWWPAWSSLWVWWCGCRRRSSLDAHSLCPSSQHPPETSDLTTPGKPMDLQSLPDRENRFQQTGGEILVSLQCDVKLCKKDEPF